MLSDRGIGWGGGRVCLLIVGRIGCCVAMHGAAVLINNSSWDWELGLQRKGVLSDCGIAWCVVMGGAAFYLTTRLGIGSLDFRGKGCSLIVGSLAVL